MATLRREIDNSAGFSYASRVSGRPKISTGASPNQIRGGTMKPHSHAAGEKSTLSRRNFLTTTSCFGAAAAYLHYLPSPVLAESILQDKRIAATPIADKGYATIRKIGDGVYATISDPSKGYDTLSNGGFIIGRDSALMIEGFHTPRGAILQLETYHSVEQGARQRRAGHALSLRSYARQRRLWRARYSHLGPRRQSSADAEELRRYARRRISNQSLRHSRDASRCRRRHRQATRARRSCRLSPASSNRR